MKPISAYSRLRQRAISKRNLQKIRELLDDRNYFQLYAEYCVKELFKRRYAIDYDRALKYIGDNGILAMTYFNYIEQTTDLTTKECIIMLTEKGRELFSGTKNK